MIAVVAVSAVSSKIIVGPVFDAFLLVGFIVHVIAEVVVESGVVFQIQIETTFLPEVIADIFERIVSFVTLGRIL